VRPFTAGAVSGFVERVDGQLRAVSGICTHQGCYQIGGGGRRSLPDAVLQVFKAS
jgi:Rieske Fe-S protein